MSSHHAQIWVTGGPRWGALLAPVVPDRDAFARPEVLRLAGDQFMEELLALLDEPEATRAARLSPLALPGGAPKLFQPAHGHYAVVLASLVCQLPGLPEHVPGRDEKVGFVMRRIEGGVEHAWVPTAAGTNPAGRWVAVTEPKALWRGEGEEEALHGLFPVRWRDGATTRGAWAGVIPVSGREAYESAGSSTPAPPAGGSPLLWESELKTRVIDPIAGLILASASAATKPDDTTRQVASRFALLDLADILEGSFGSAWLDAPPAPASLAAWTLLDTTAAPVPGGRSDHSLREAARRARSHRAALLSTGTWSGAPAYDLTGLGSIGWASLGTTLTAALKAAGLPQPDATGAAAPASLPRVSTGSASYRVRCVYLRPPCGLRPTEVVSTASRRFRLATFLDLDAPQRETRITLPTDPSIEGLRKLEKSVGIVMSAAMRAKTEAAASKDVLDGKAVKVPSLTLGWITVWSIPILTLCATILLMIIASLLNLVFWWLPFLRITIPVVTVEEPE